MITEEQITFADMDRLSKQGVTCAECGAIILLSWGGYYGVDSWILICSKDVKHEGLARLYVPSATNVPDINLPNVGKRRKQQMSKEYGEEAIKALIKYEGKGQLTELGAKEIVTTLWPGAPKLEVYKAVNICVQYGLNPLMKHLFMIPFNKGKTNETWVAVLGIQANRLIAHRSGDFSYIDDTPRIMSEAEQIKKYGSVDKSMIRAITKLRDSKGNEAPGYGAWPIKDTPFGVDKGNSPHNMAFIRSERQAFDRLFAGKMPENIDVVDERFASSIKAEDALPNVDEDTGEILEDKPVEGEVRELSDDEAAVEGSPAQAEEQAVKVASQTGKPEGDQNPPLPKTLPFKTDPETVKSITDLYKSCHRDFNLQPADVLRELNKASSNDITETPGDCYKRISAVYNI